MCRERDGSTFNWSLMLEEPCVSPAVAGVEASSADVAGDDGKPCQIEPLADRALGMPEQCRRHAASTSSLGYVDLLEFVVTNHDEAGHIRPDCGDRGAVQQSGDPRTEIGEPTMFQERFRNMPEMALWPPAMPHSRDGIDIVGGCRPKFRPKGLSVGVRTR